MRVGIYIRIQAGANSLFGHSSSITWKTVGESKGTQTSTQSLGLGYMNTRLRYAGPQPPLANKLSSRPVCCFTHFFLLSPFPCSVGSSLLSQPFCIFTQITFHSSSNQTVSLLPHVSPTLVLYEPLSTCLLNNSPIPSHHVYPLSPSVHRYTAVVMPVHYQHGTGQSSCRRVALMITAVWVLAFAVSCPLLFGFNTTGKNDGPSYNTHVIHSTPEWLSVVLSLEISDPDQHTL